MATVNKKCEYGVLGLGCGAPATTKRRWPSGIALMDVCPQHAQFLDRLAERIRQDSGLLARLAER